MSAITVAELQHLLQEQAAQNLIDVRTPVEFAEVHVEGFKNVPLNELRLESLNAQPSFSPERPVYLLCRSGQRASLAATQLANGGFPNAVVVEGGVQAWIAAGLPVKRGSSGVISLERQVRIGAGSLVLTGVILGSLVHPGFYGLSAFVGAGLVFAGITDWCGLGLLLARAPWNRKVA
jgi:rhodanese-related sulfurtransferase